MVIEDLQIMLLNSHLYIGYYCHIYELIREKLVEEQEKITIRLYVNLQQDQRTYNLPTAEKIAVIIPEEEIYHTIDNRDVVLQTRGGQLPRISQNSPSYTALYYVLLFSKGKNGWYPRISICKAQLRERDENMKQREERACSQYVSDTCYYIYHLYIREGSQPPLFYSKKLFQQFVINAWVNCEQRKLNWTRTYQYTLRSKLYQGLQHTAIYNRYNRYDGKDTRPLGHKFILFSSHVGSPRFMTQLFQDAMAVYSLFPR